MQLRGEADREMSVGPWKPDLIWYWAAKSITFFSGEIPPKCVEAART